MRSRGAVVDPPNRRGRSHDATPRPRRYFSMATGMPVLADSSAAKTMRWVLRAVLDVAAWLRHDGWVSVT